MNVYKYNLLVRQALPLVIITIRYMRVSILYSEQILHT